MLTEKGWRILPPLALSFAFHLVLIAVGYLLISEKAEEEPERAILVEVMNLRKLKVPRTFISKEPIPPTPPIITGSIHSPKTEYRLDLPKTYTQLNLNERQTELTLPKGRGDYLPRSDFIALRDTTVSLRFDHAVQLPGSLTHSWVDLNPSLEADTSGFPSFLLSSPAFQLSLDNISDLLEIIRRKIESAKQYPKEAQRSGYEGTVVVSFSINLDGNLEEVRVIRSSGYSVLDEAAVMTIKRAAPFPPLRGYVTRRSLTLEVPITFKLKGDI